MFGLDTSKKWQRSFFYVKNRGGLVDHHGLPKFVIGTPSRTSWKYIPDAELNAVGKQIKELQEQLMFRGPDMVGAFVSRRVSPLQRRAHKICHMGG